MLYLIERAKKCPDFSATLYIIHLLLCILYGGFPSSFTWWVVNATGLAIMAFLSEHLCIKRELREIPITRYRSSKNLAHLSLLSHLWPCCELHIQSSFHVFLQEIVVMCVIIIIFASLKVACLFPKELQFCQGNCISNLDIMFVIAGSRSHPKFIISLLSRLLPDLLPVDHLFMALLKLIILILLFL